MAAPWTRHYDPEVPPSLAPYPEKTLVDYLRETAVARPGAPAILFKGRSISNAELDRLSGRFAASLRRVGVRKGDRVALLLPNSPQFLIAEFGAWKAGATVLPLNPLYTGSELREPLKAAGVEVVVTLTPFYKRLKEIQRETPSKVHRRDQHQGVSAAASTRAVRALEGKERGPSHRARARRRVVPGLPERRRVSRARLPPGARHPTTPPSC